LVINDYFNSLDYYIVLLGFKHSIILFYLRESNNKII
jgi:hypothetical protein